MRFKLSICACGVAVVASATSRRAPEPLTGGGCPPAITHFDSLYDYSLRETVILNINIHGGTIWGNVKVPVAAANEVRTVRDDAKCDRALRLLRSFIVDTAFIPTELRMVHVDKYYIGQEGPHRGNEFQAVYVFDQDLKQVLYPCKTGLPCK